MNLILENWIYIVLGIALGIVLGEAIYVFINKPTKEQISKIKEWLLYAVMEAEKELGGGTGQLKLKFVYDMFITRFPALSTMISFTAFNKLVEEVLEEFKEILETNESIKEYVNN